MFIDTSAIVAIIISEAEAASFVEKIRRTKQCYTSPVVVWESTMVLARIIFMGKDETFDEDMISKSRQLVSDLINKAKICMVGIQEKEMILSIEAMAKYGRGSGSPAKLNMGDCFTYACAKSYKLSLLFKGNDFIHTDIKKA